MTVVLFVDYGKNLIKKSEGCGWDSRDGRCIWIIEEMQLELHLDIINRWRERWPMESVCRGSRRVREEKDQEVSLHPFKSWRTKG